MRINSTSFVAVAAAALLLVCIIGVSGTEKREHEGAEEENTPKNTAPQEEEMVDAPEERESEEELSKQPVKNFTCQVTGALLSMSKTIMSLDKDIRAIKEQMFKKCPGFSANETDDTEDSVDALNLTGESTELEEDDTESDHEEQKQPLLPPIPAECDEPFQPVANSCYYFLYYPADWKTWGDANAYCQTIGGTLAAPYRIPDLRQFLKENFSNVFWVGAKKSDAMKNTFQWLNGNEVAEEDWKEGQPSKAAAKFCVYLEFFSGYKAVNHYCGEKFSFVCEERDE